VTHPAVNKQERTYEILRDRIHTGVYAPMALLQQTHDRLDRVRATMFAYLPHRAAESVKEHERLLELLESGDAGEVERYARWHKLQTVEAYRAIR
jgi:DNA-binding GntR family transcriptional regulator